MAANHPLAVSRNLRLTDCLQYGFVLPDRSIGIRQVIESAFAEAHIEVAGAITTNSITLIKSMLRLGQMLAILSVFDVLSESMRGELAFLPVGDRKLEAETLVIAVPSNRRPSPPAQAMIDIVRSAIRGVDETRLQASRAS